MSAWTSAEAAGGNVLSISASGTGLAVGFVVSVVGGETVRGEPLELSEPMLPSWEIPADGSRL